MIELRPGDVVRIHPDTTEWPGPGDIGLVESVGPRSARLYTDVDTVRWLAREECERTGHLETGEFYIFPSGERLVGECLVEIFYERGSDGIRYRFEVGAGLEMSLSGRMVEPSPSNVLRDALYRLVQDVSIEEVG